jgi:hypothetical protein
MPFSLDRGAASVIRNSEAHHLLEEFLEVILPVAGFLTLLAAQGADSEKAREFWSFRPVREPAVPEVRDASWPRNAVDRFVLARIEAAGLKPVAEADRRTLVRRATFDLTGLPPTPEEVETFVADDAPDAFDRLVDRLLASPRYGERWGRHWLDVVRYADTAGDSADYPIPQAWRYRNYVIDAFNKDKPYDRFVREQIAGDLLGGETLEERHEGIVATGFIALSRRSGEDPDEEHHITIDDTIDTVGKAFLGLNLGCSRCHNNKFDPIPQSDYYALYGIFASTRYAYPGSDHKKYPRDFVPLLAPEEADLIARPFDEKLAALEAELLPLSEELLVFENAVGGIVDEAAKSKGRTLEELKAAHKAVKKKCDDFGKTRPAYPMAFAASEGRAADARIHISGNPAKPGAEVPRGFLQVLGGQRLPEGERGSGRRQLADWLADAGNPLTARVMVNRIWQHHFGRGIVETPSSFDSRGMPPSHPELLDFLACRFIESGWSAKTMHRLLMRSATYRLSSRGDAESARIDPTVRLRWRFDRRRLEAESIRDAILAVSGALDLSVPREHPFPPAAKWNYSEATPFFAIYPSPHRSVYLMQPRIQRHPFLALFDGADPNFSVAARHVSTTSVEALFMMNDSFVREQAAKLVERLRRERRGVRERIDLAHRLLFARPATADEVERGEAYLRRLAHLEGTWASYARVLLSANEFITVD